MEVLLTKGFLPVCRQDMIDRNIKQFDFVYVIGDAYVDHPSFGHAIISRILEAHGYSVGIISQPDWKNADSIDIFGRPRLGFLISGGNMDSMVNHYYVSQKKRQMDAYTPGGVMGKRPDYATVVYCNLIRQTYKDVPILIGGIEASLRRLGHYDYWSESMKQVFADLHTTITGVIPLNVLYCLTVRQILFLMGWESGLLLKLPMHLTAE